MVKRLKYYSQLGLLIFLMCLFSCRRIIDIKLPHRPQLIMHGYVGVGEQFTVTLARSDNSVQYDTLLYMKNAWVALYENGVFKDSLLFNAQQKKYIARSAIAEYGKTYTMRAGADGYPVAEAMAMAPQPVPTVDIIHKKNARISDYGEWFDDVQFSFKDPAEIKNYYIVALHPSTHFSSSIVCLYSTDPAIDRENADVLPAAMNKCMDSKSILFNDQSFNGSLKQMTLSGWPKAFETITDDSGFVYKPYLKRYSISREFYTYFKNIKGQDFEAGIPYMNVPAVDIGNVTNGYGLFTIFSLTTDSLP